MDYTPYVRKLPGRISDWVGNLSSSIVMAWGACPGHFTFLQKDYWYRHQYGNTEFEQCASIAEKFRLQYPNNLGFRQVEAREVNVAVQFDCIYSWSVFEHVDWEILDDVVSGFRSVLKDGGLVFTQIAPLYYSPGGAHLYDICDEPWIHLTRQRNRLKADILCSDHPNKERIWSCYGTLNKLTADRLVDLFESHGFKVERGYRS
jgi:hypothetical protein